MKSGKLESNEQCGKAELLNDYFISLFGQSKTPILTGTRGGLNGLKISDKELSDIVSHLNADKSTGPNSIGNLILKNAITLFVNPGNYFFKHSRIKCIFQNFEKLVSYTNFQRRR